jgi:hypothetical protein
VPLHESESWSRALRQFLPCRREKKRNPDSSSSVTGARTGLVEAGNSTAPTRLQPNSQAKHHRTKERKNDISSRAESPARLPSPTGQQLRGLRGLRGGGGPQQIGVAWKCHHRVVDIYPRSSFLGLRNGELGGGRHLRIHHGNHNDEQRVEVHRDCAEGGARHNISVAGCDVCHLAVRHVALCQRHSRDIR